MTGHDTDQLLDAFFVAIERGDIDPVTVHRLLADESLDRLAQLGVGGRTTRVLTTPPMSSTATRRRIW